MHIALLAGEVSGDRLGAPLLRELKKRYPRATFSGVGGRHMIAAGLKSLVPIEKLSVMGLVEVIRHLPDLVAVKKQLLAHWHDDPPDLFIGIDAPDFNLRIAAALHHQGVKTVHYVSPSLWAWKEKRIHSIIDNIDLMLCLFPFETSIYEENGVRAVCVGHPLRDRLRPMSKIEAREALGLPLDVPILGIFPGSRASEVKRLAPIFLKAFTALQAKIPHLHGLLSQLVPLEDELLLELPDDVYPSDADSALLMSAADVLLLASGTITLEAALLSRPQVAAYRVNPVTAAIARHLLNIDRFSLPNLLAGEDLVPECIQEHCHPREICAALLPLFSFEPAEKQLQGFAQIVHNLPVGVSARAADALADLFIDDIL